MSAIVAKPVSTFRQMVESIPSVDAQIVTKFLYETGGRASEAAVSGKPEMVMRTIKDRQTGQKHQELREATRPCGPKRSDVSFDTYEGQEVMLITMTILKRKLKTKDDQPLHLARIVGLPLGFDPWVKELADYIETLSPSDGIIPYNRFDISRLLLSVGMTAQNLLNAPLDYRIENPLRHMRITHLLSHYGFNDEEVRKFIGWARSSNWGSTTQTNYEHTNWQYYVAKLLKPLPTTSRTFNPVTPSPNSVQSAFAP